MDIVSEEELKEIETDAIIRVIIIRYCYFWDFLKKKVYIGRKQIQRPYISLYIYRFLVNL